jgi:hypothetical protein
MTSLQVHKGCSRQLAKGPLMVFQRSQGATAFNCCSVRMFHVHQLLNKQTWLLVWNMKFMTFHSVENGKVIPTDELHHFSEG